MKTFKRTLYAVAHILNKEFLVSVGVSVLAAWHAAEDCLGSNAKTLQRDGYIILELDCWYFKKVMPKTRRRS